jgi:hypothetical protein
MMLDISPLSLVDNGFFWLYDRMLVYEYVNNGNLEQWLHGDVGPCSPLTWENRMNIILGTAKGYDPNHSYLSPSFYIHSFPCISSLALFHWPHVG